MWIIPFLGVAAGFIIYRRVKRRQLSSDKKLYCGHCHCNSVKFTVEAPKHLVVWDCNCSICLMKKNWHFIVPATSFHLTSGWTVPIEMYLIEP